MGADHRTGALGTFRRQWRVPPRALGSGLLAGLAARRRRLLRAWRRGTFAGTTVPAAHVAARRIAPAAKRRIGRGDTRAGGGGALGGSDEGGRELLVEFSAKRSLNSIARV